MKLSNRTVVVILLAMVLLSGATWAWAQAGGQQIRACVKGGKVTALGPADEVICDADKEKTLEWNSEGPTGPSGLNCWDLNGNGQVDPEEEDLNGDGSVDVLDCQGPPGEAGASGPDGSPGLNCWDLNGNGQADTGEDLNGDGNVDALDCQGPQGEPGPQGPEGVCALDERVEALECEVFGTNCPPSPSKYVFVSSLTYTGNLGGLSGADAKCQALAEGAGLSGSYMAWLSDESQCPADRFTKWNGPYVLPDGTRVADNWDDLVDGSLLHQINLTEKETAAAPHTVWTGTLADGSLAHPGQTCVGWTTTDGGGGCGNTSATDNQWTAFTYGHSCTNRCPIYCFEQ